MERRNSRERVETAATKSEHNEAGQIPKMSARNRNNGPIVSGQTHIFVWANSLGLERAA